MLIYNNLRLSEPASKLLTVILPPRCYKKAYEQEWRAVKHGAIGAHPFAKSALREIIFGCKAEPKFVESIKQLANEHGFSHVTYLQARSSETSFSLTLAPL